MQSCVKSRNYPRRPQSSLLAAPEVLQKQKVKATAELQTAKALKACPHTLTEAPWGRLRSLIVQGILGNLCLVIK